MPYIGVSPSNGVRQTYDYTATAGQTSFSGSDNNSQTLAYTDSAYIDVYQNGILLIPSDYTATTGTTVVLDTGATVSDTLQIVVYDVFSVADTVSASDGGSFGGNLGVGGTLSVTGETTLATHLNMGDDDKIKLGAGSDLQIYHDGSHSYIQDNGTGNLRLKGANIEMVDNDDGGSLLQAVEGGAVTLYNNNSAKFETQSDGCKTHGVARINTNAANSYSLYVTNDGNNTNRYGIAIVCGEDSGSGTNYLMGFHDGDGGSVGSITFSGSNTSFNTSSDYRLKNNIVDLTDATAKVKELKPKKFSWKKDTNNTLIHGFLAHEVAEVIPEAVVGKKDEVDDDDKPIYQGIDHSKLVPLLVKTIQELEARITALESK